MSNDNTIDDLINETLKHLNINEFEFDPNVDYKEIDAKTYEFKDNDKTYYLECIASLTSDKKLIYDFKFKLMNNPKLPNKKDFKDDRQYDIAIRNSQVGITGTGNAFKIFSKVISIIIKY